MKLAKIFTISFFAILLFSLFGQVIAFSEETTGLTLANVDRNLGKFARVGSFYVFATDKLLLFYDSGGVLVKTKALYTSGLDWHIAIATLNSTHLLFAQTYRNGYDVDGYFGILNVNTLGVTSLLDGKIGDGTTGTPIPYDLIIAETSNTNFYVVCSFYYSTGTNHYKTSVYRVYPTYASVGSSDTTTDASIYLFAPSSYVLSETASTSTIYVIGRDTASGTRYKIGKIDLVTPSFTAIGTSGLDGDYSSYVYFFGYSYDTVGSSTYYDVGVVYPHISTDKEFFPAIIRFNDTFIDSDHRASSDPASAVNFLRILSVPFSGIRPPNELLEGSYRAVFVGESYALMQQSFTVGGLSTDTPTVNWDYSPVTYQGKTHYYTTINSIGGLQPPEWNVMVEYDYSNGKAIADIMSAPEAEWTYSYTFSPSVTENGGIILINASQNYIYTGTLLASGLANANGYYKRYISYNGVNYTLQATGTLLNGQIRFSFSDMNPETWWRLDITAQNYGDATYTKYHHLLSSAYVPPGDGGGLTIPDTTGALSYGMGLAVNFLIPLLLVAAPAMVLGAAVGMPGIFIGLLLGLGIGGISGIVPLWMVIMIVFAMFVVLLLGGGGGVLTRFRRKGEE